MRSRRRDIAFFVLPLAPLRASAFFGELVTLFEFRNFFFEIHGGIIAGVWRGGGEPNHCCG
jgi:hypothetical protein